MCMCVGVWVWVCLCIVYTIHSLHSMKVPVETRRGHQISRCWNSRWFLSPYRSWKSNPSPLWDQLSCLLSPLWLCAYECVYLCVATVHVWESEDILWESVLSYTVHSWDQTQVVRFGSKHFTHWAVSWAPTCILNVNGMLNLEPVFLEILEKSKVNKSTKSSIRFRQHVSHVFRPSSLLGSRDFSL